MDTQTFDTLIDDQLLECIGILSVKAEEYATDDRLHNFKVAATLQDITPIEALAGMMAKHTISIYDMCGSGADYPDEVWKEKITDHINYLLILRALVQEEKQEATFDTPEQLPLWENPIEKALTDLRNHKMSEIDDAVREKKWNEMLHKITHREREVNA